MSFATDDFAGAFATELSAYNGSWSKQSGHTDNILIGEDSNSVITSGLYACYQHSGSPASADYSVFGTLRRVGANTDVCLAGVCARMEATDNFITVMQINGTNSLRLYDWIAGTPSQLGSSHALTLTADTDTIIELRCSGTTVTVHVDGGAAVITGTTSFTSAGKAGVIAYQSRYSGDADKVRIRYFDAVDAGGGGGGGSSRARFRPLFGV